MEEALTALLLADGTVSSLTGAGDRLTWDVIPQGKAGAAAVMYLISAIPDYHTAGPSGLVESRVQIDCRASTKADALALARAIETTLSGYSGTVAGIKFKPIMKVGSRSRFDKTDAERFYLASADYQVWSGLAA
jgi:hypothetical protein